MLVTQNPGPKFYGRFSERLSDPSASHQAWHLNLTQAVDRPDR
jgi:hypothetical protein